MSVAIRAITRIQDGDDAPSLGAGQDGYALTWDNASGAFVATALFTGGLLATGATTGATNQAQAFTNGVVTGAIKPAADSTTALQLQNATGTSVLNVDTTNGRVGIGTTAPAYLLTIGNGGTGSASPGFAVDGGSGTNGGPYCSFRRNGISQAWFGTDSGVIGGTSSDLSFVALTGNGVRFYAGGDSSAYERLRITSTGLVGIGTTAPATLLHGLLTSAATNAVTNVVTIGHDTSGTVANGFGAGLLYQLESSTTAAQNAARIQALWNDATHATRKADLVLSAYDTAEREGLRIRGAGSAAAIGFYGVTPIARATLATGAGASVDDVITALQNLGLVKQS